MEMLPAKGENDDDEENPKSGCCCISHEFYNSASRNLGKVAVIHAIRGGARLAGDRHRKRISHHQAHHHNRPHPPVFNGDQCFTYSDLLTAVDALSFRLHHILNGGDDPCLVRPNLGNGHSQYPDPGQVYTSCDISLEQSREFHNKDATKIVGVYMAPSVDYVVAVLSILRSGHTFLPLDSSLPRERLLSFLSSSDIALIIGQNYSDDKGTNWQHNGSVWDIASCSWPLLHISMDILLTDKPDHLHSYFSCGSHHLRRFDYVMYTSGSTGKPKGICGTEQGLLNRFMWMRKLYPFDDDEILMFKTPISFVDHLQEFLPAILSGCTLVVPPSSVLKTNVHVHVLLLQDYNVSRFIAVPSLMRMLLPALQNPDAIQKIQYSLRLLVLSGEVFPITLWDTLSRLLPKTVILNLYGSAEVSGDCAYYDCKRLPALLESEILTSVPIGVSISNCNVILLKDGTGVEGEICVSGVCLSRGYFSASQLSPFDYVELPVDPLCPSGNKFFRTGDFARELPSGDLVFIGRKDRTVKVNGQRVALEEIEDTLRGHPNVADAAVILPKNQGMHAFLGAYLVIEDKTTPIEVLTSVRTWVVDKLPAAMIPRRLSCIEAMPTTSTGKVDYALLSDSVDLRNDESHYLTQTAKLLEHIKKVFSNALAVTEVGSDDDFFMLGGDSILAAEVAYLLGINMSLLYMYPSPLLLEKALLKNAGGSIVDRPLDHEIVPRTYSGVAFNSFASSTSHPIQELSQIIGLKDDRSFLGTYNTKDLEGSKRLKLNQGRCFSMKDLLSLDLYPWRLKSSFKLCALSHCNRVMFDENSAVNELWRQMCEIKLPRNSRGLLRDMWNVQMISCVDASPVIALKNKEIRLFIGSHSHKFCCIDAQSGFVMWERKLAGRIECSATIDGDFSQVVVGCYEGRIYFLDFFTGNICWSFQTYGEVKSQPVVDKRRHLIWCGSHDHNLYGLDYRNHCCIHQYACGGSVFSSPTIDKVHDVLYVATTNGRLTAILLKEFAFSVLWLLELEAPVFGSLALSSAGNVICCLVNGNVVTLDYKGSVVWRVRVGGPIFSGACISNALPSQVLVCSRDGYVYSLELGDGSILWKYNVGDPITASAYVDEQIKLASDPSLPSDRFVCICTSSGRIVLLRAGAVSSDDPNQPQRHWVEKFAETDLEGDIFSSPVMVGGRIFVGCRDDYLHCVLVEGQLSA